MKTLTFILVIGFLGLTLSQPLLPVQALTQQSAPYVTYTLGPNGRKVQTQTAYEPAGYFDMDLRLRLPEDMVRFGDDLYVADTGNNRIVKFNMFTGEGTILLEGLSQPMGIHLNDQGELYVADKTDRKIYQYDAEMNLIQTYGRPNQAIFGADSPFVPLKVTSGPRGILYVVGEGSTAGLMQLNSLGEFIGFFATNSTTFSWLQTVSNFFGINRATNIPTSPTNVALDDKGSVFTVSNLNNQQVKKFNIASQTILSMSQVSQPVSVHINDFGNIFTLSQTGIINEYDGYGNMIFEFGGLDTGNRISGLYVNPIDIFTDDAQNLWILDKGTGQIQLLQRSEFAYLVHQGLINFKDGIYDLSQWENVLRMNSLFALANASLARGHYRLQAYEEALRYYTIAFDRQGFSEAFWQLRYTWLELNLATVLLVFVFAFAALKLWQWGKSRLITLGPIQQLLQQPIIHQMNQDLRLTSHVLAHPLDTYQEIKHLKKSSWLMASLLYIAVLIVSVFEIFNTGFIFQTVNLNQFHLLIHTSTVLGGIFLFVFSNYLVATITNGEGFFKDVYVSTAHALMPYIILTPILAIMSNGLTFNEVIVYQLLDGLRFVWSGALVLLMIKEVHNYDVKALLKNIFFTLFTMMMLVLVGFLLYVLTTQLWNYVESIIQEVILRG